MWLEEYPCRRTRAAQFIRECEVDFVGRELAVYLTRQMDFIPVASYYNTLAEQGVKPMTGEIGIFGNVRVCVRERTKVPGKVGVSG